MMAGRTRMTKAGCSSVSFRRFSAACILQSKGGFFGYRPTPERLAFLFRVFLVKIEDLITVSEHRM
jgi:hypothetical protein